MKRGYILVIAAGLLMMLVVNYLKTVEQKRMEIRDALYVKTKKYLKYREMTGSRETIEKILKKHESLLGRLESGLLPRKDENSARVFMQELISNYADEAGLTMTSLRTLERVDQRHYTGVPVQITVAGDMGGVVEFLRKITDSGYLITIDLLSIRVINIRDPYKVRMRGHFTGYIRKGG